MRQRIKNNDRLTNVISIIILLILSYNFISNCLEINFIQDDAYTSFRYAKNFVEGEGLVFNEGERVEGYTNFLWVMMLSVFQSMDIELETASQVMSLIFGTAAIWFTFLLARLLIGNGESKIFYPIIHLLPPFLVSYSAPMMYWSVSGMETSLFITLTLLTIFLFCNREKREFFGYPFIAVSFLNSFVRPEGIFIFILLCLFDYLAIRYKLYPNISHDSIRYLNKKRVSEIFVYIILIFTYITFRLAYYGYLLPNTFYAKTDFSTQFLVRGFNYFLEFVRNNLLFGLLLVLPAFAYRNSKHHVIFFYYFILINFTAIIFIGGDVLPIYRFFLPFLPIVFVFSIKGILSLVDLVNSNLKILKATIVIIMITITTIYGITNYQEQLPFVIEKRSYETGLVKKMKICAEWVEARSVNQNRITVALSTIGSFSFNTNARIIDIVGLANEYIAHNPKEVKGIDEELPVLWKERHYNAEYVLNQKPDYIIFPAGARPTAFAECALFAQQKFYRNYYIQLIYSSELNQLLPVFTKRKEPRQPGYDCDVRFLKHYIKASTIVNQINPGNKSDLMIQLVNNCDSARAYCESRLADINTIEGIGFFNVGDYDKSAKLFMLAVKTDSLNMIAHFYSMKIAEMQESKAELIYHFGMLEKYSPSVFGSYTN